MRILRTLASALTAALLLSGLATGAKAQTSEPGSSLRVITLNVAGGARNHGKVSGVRAAVLALDSRFRPDEIGLQEVCSGQYKALRKALKARGYRGAAFTATRSSGSCRRVGGDNRFGNALFVRESISQVEVYRLPWGANARGSFARQPRSMICATTGTSRERICTVHLTPRNPDRRNQIKRVAELLRGPAASGGLVLTCDCNSSRDAAKYLEFLQSSNPARKVTTDSKKSLDWVLSNREVRLVKIVPQKVSDHHALIAEVS